MEPLAQPEIGSLGTQRPESLPCVSDGRFGDSSGKPNLGPGRSTHVECGWMGSRYWWDCLVEHLKQDHRIP